MAELKTKPTKANVDEFLAKVEDETQRADSRVILDIMRKISGEPPVMWGPTMIGFGQYHYKYESGHEGDSFRIGFSPRKGQMSLYFMPGVCKFQNYLAKLGKHKMGKACLYIKKLADVDVNVLREMIEAAYAEMAQWSSTPEAPKKSPAKKKK